MDLFFEVTEGPRKGFGFKIRPGLTIGRVEGDVSLNDPKVSSQHAHIEENEKGQLVLVDDNSTNGIIINGITVPSVVLIPGVSVQLGKTFLRVAMSFEISSIVPEPEPTDWKNILKKNFITQGLHFRPIETNIQPLNPALRLAFIQGIQTDESWTLGYGPRKAGAQSLDLPIHEVGAPDICFEIVPSEGGILWKTDFPDLVKLNNLSKRSDKLLEGDTITIGSTVIQVNFYPS